MHEIGMLRLVATMEVVTGTRFFTLVPGDAMYPVRGYIARLQQGMFILCDEGCGTVMFRSYGWMDRFEVETENGAFYCEPCDRKLVEEEFGYGYNEYEREEWAAQCAHCSYVAIDLAEWEEHVLRCEHVALEIRLGGDVPTLEF